MSTEKLARSIYRKAAAAKDAYRRKRVAFPACAEPNGDPAVYFLTPDFQAPAGGIRVIYRHVDILNSAGLRAFVLHWRPGFKCSWFEHETKVMSIARIELRKGDVIVVPELDVDLVPRLPAGVGYVIFNQNSHLTWNRMTGHSARTYARGTAMKGIATVSGHNLEMLRYAFPETRIHRVHLGIDPALFHPGSAKRSRRIAYMPRRGRADARQVLEMLRNRGVLDGWEIVALNGLTHEEVAEQLRTTRIFLAFTHQEGFGLPAAEAMACGNYVIGNHGFGGREFFRPDFSVSIEAGDTVGFARAVESAIDRDRADADWCAERGRLASDFILREYSQARERQEVTQLYAQFLGFGAPVSEAAE